MGTRTLINDTFVQGFRGIELHNGLISVTVLPELGGKISSIRNVATGREWLWTSPFIEYKEPRYGASYIEEYDSGGIDECFPTVDACHHPSHPWDGVYVPDHGEVFSQEWEVESSGIGL